MGRYSRKRRRIFICTITCCLINGCSISIGRTSAKDSFEEFEGGFGAEDERWRKFAHEALRTFASYSSRYCVLTSRSVLRDDSDALIDKTGKLVLPAWDEDELTPKQAKELLSKYLIQLWRKTTSFF